jgi:two-component system sensor histidine kinase EvgS
LVIGALVGSVVLIGAGAWIVAVRRRQSRTEAASRSAARILAYASHEVRNPVHGIAGLAEMLERSTLNAEQRRLVETIRETALGLGRLADDFLQHARLNLGQLPPRPTTTAPSALVESVMALERTVAERKRIRLQARVGNDVPAFVEVDASRLRQVLLNLVGNAIRHSAAGEVVIGVSKVAGSNHRLRFEVRDSGRGLGPSERERLFQPFSHDEATARPAEAVGIGLWISKQMIESLGGAIGIDPQTVRGSCFWFEVGAPACPAPAGSDASPPSPLPPIEALVVDDDPVSLEVTLAQLGHLGVNARGSIDPIEVTGALGGTRCDLVLMDYDMPGLDGLALARRVCGRTPEAALRPRLVILSGTDRARLGAAGNEIEVDDWLLKPVSIDELSTALQRLFGKGPVAGIAPPPAAVVAPPVLDEATIADLARLRIEGKAADAVLASRVRRAMDRHLAPLAEAVSSGNRSAAAALAHRLRGTVSPLGCTALATALGSLEDIMRRAPGRSDDEAALARVQAAGMATRAALDLRYGEASGAPGTPAGSTPPSPSNVAPN